LEDNWGLFFFAEELQKRVGLGERKRNQSRGNMGGPLGRNHKMHARIYASGDAAIGQESRQFSYQPNLDITRPFFHADNRSAPYFCCITAR